MQIGIISDTHGKLPLGVLDIFNRVNYIFHAGDIGDPDIIRKLENICPVYAIYGNIDTYPVISKYTRTLTKTISSKEIYLVHNIVNIRYHRYELFKKGLSPDIVIYGHTHKPDYQIYQNTVYINPGSASNPKEKEEGTVAVMDLDKNIQEPIFYRIKKEEG
jgi:putative phosphoesterase